MSAPSCRPTFVEVNLAAIAHNLREIKKQVAPAEIMAVVKADAYGHGLKEVSKTAIENGVCYLGVARLEEGVILRENNFDANILVFGGFFESQIEDFLKFGLELTLYDMYLAKALSEKAKQLGKTAKVHIKVDTGMGRVGVAWQKAADFVQDVVELNHLEIVGIYTHFANADEKDKSFAHTQLKRFNHALTRLDEKQIEIPLKHAANSGAILDLPESYFDMVRPGVMMYGYYPSLETSETVAIEPSMSIKSRVILIKEVEEGTPISYGLTFRAKQKTKIATVPFGYGDGFNRLLSNKGEVLIQGQRFPVVGRVTMDQIMVEVGAESAVQTGDEVVLLGRQGREEITIHEICKKLNTIPYEVTCWVSERIPKVYKSMWNEF
ncbi:MAG: alanine racemase [bacterium]